MRENRPSGLEGGVAVTRHPYPYFVETAETFLPSSVRSGMVAMKSGLTPW
jgi:hypothetical protein